MKKIKYLIFLMFIFGIFTTKTNAGLCNGLAVASDGYCTLKVGYRITGVFIQNASISSLLYYTSPNSEPMSKVRYYLAKDGTSDYKDAFCLDANLLDPKYDPPELYMNNGAILKYAHELDVNSEIDLGLLTIYQFFLATSAWSITNKGNDADSLLQPTNSAMRIFMARIDANIGKCNYGDTYCYNHSSDAKKNYPKWLRNAGSTFEGKKVTGTTVYTGNSVYRMPKLYYCAAVVESYIFEQKTGGTKYFDKDSYDHCYSYLYSDYDGNHYVNTNSDGEVYFSFPQGIFDVKLAKDTSDEETNKSEVTADENGDFTKKIKIKIQEDGKDGFNKIVDRWGTYLGYLKDLDFEISSVSCNSSSVTCTLDDQSLINKNLLGSKDLASNLPDIYVNVSGNTANLTKVKNLKINIKYKYRFPWSASNMAILKYNNNTQRFAMFIPDEVFNQNLNIDLSLPSACKTTTEVDEATGVTSQTYTIGGKTVTVGEYIDQGCCNIDSSLLTNEDDKNAYFDKCGVEDDVHLENKCTQTCDEVTKSSDVYSHSYVHQMPIDKVMKKVTLAESTYANSLGTILDSTTNTVRDEYESVYSDINDNLTDTYSKLKNYMDDSYVHENVEKKETDDIPAGSSAEVVTEADPKKDNDHTIGEPANDYCMLYTSENNDIYLPTTTVATSGQFFVFSKKTQPKIDGEINVDMHTDYDRWKNDLDNAVEKEKTAYTAWQTQENKADALDESTITTSSGSCKYDCVSSTVSDGKGGTTVSVSCSTENYTTYTVTSDGTGAFKTYYNADSSPQPYDSESWNNATHCNQVAKPTANPSGTKAIWQNYKNERLKLQKYKAECELRNNLDIYWNYSLDPDVNFFYSQNYIQNNEVVNEVSTALPMTISNEAVKYWIHPTEDELAATKIQKVPVTDAGTANLVDTTIEYGAGEDGQHIIDKSTTDSNKDYKAAYKQTKWYKAKNRYYAIIESGKVITSEESGSFEGTSTEFDTSTGKYVEIGYVYSIQITNYKGQYSTWFTINNIGHLFNSYKDYKDGTDEEKKAYKDSHTSNAQTSMNKYMSDNYNDIMKQTKGIEKSADYTSDINKKIFASKCYYCDTEDIIKRKCRTCPDPTDQTKIVPQYIYRTVKTTNINPNNRTLGPNWSADDPKGRSAREQIEAVGSNIISNVIDTTYKNLNNVDSKNSSLTLLNDNKSVDTKKDSSNKKLLASSGYSQCSGTTDIYDDSTRCFLEYEFVLTSKEMNEIKASNDELSNSEGGNGYSTMNINDDADDLSGYQCNSSSKECISNFVTKYAKTTEGRDKWKYYVYDPKTSTGSFKMFSKGAFGAYPEPEDKTGYVYLSDHPDYP